MSEENPYIEEEVNYTVKKFNPKFGNERMCECGHTYERHFDWMEDNKFVGCKYCGCDDFVERKEEPVYVKRQIKLYLHGDDESIWGKICRMNESGANFTDIAKENFSRALYEVEFVLEVDEETGNYIIIEVSEGDTKLVPVEK